MVVLWENENDVAALLLLLLLWLRAKFWCCCRNPEPASTAVCLASRERAGVKPTRRALGLDTQLSQTCLKKLLQRSQLLTNWPPHGDSLIIVLQKLSNIHWFSRGFKERERELWRAGTLLWFVILMLPVFGTRSNDRASPVTAAPVWAEAGNPSFSSLWLIGSLPPVQDKLPRRCYCHWKEQINVTAGLQEVGHLGDELTVTDNTKPRAPFVSTQQVAVQPWFELPFTSITPICWRPGGPSTTHRCGLKTCDQSKGVCVRLWAHKHTNTDT